MRNIQLSVFLAVIFFFIGFECLAVNAAKFEFTVDRYVSEGNYSIEYSDDNVSQESMISQRIPVFANGQYEISADVFTTFGASSITIRELTGENVLIKPTEFTFPQSEDWVNFKITLGKDDFTLSNNVAWVEIYISASSNPRSANTGKAYFDNVSFKDLSDGAELLKNGGFEDGLSGWKIYGDTFAGISLKIYRKKENNHNSVISANDAAKQVIENTGGIFCFSQEFSVWPQQSIKEVMSKLKFSIGLATITLDYSNDSMTLHEGDTLVKEAPTKLTRKVRYLLKVTQDGGDIKVALFEAGNEFCPVSIICADKTFELSGDISFFVENLGLNTIEAELFEPEINYISPVISSLDEGNIGDEYLQLASTFGANIYYMLDGANPKTSGVLYTGPFKLTEGDYKVRAIAALNGEFGQEKEYNYSVIKVMERFSSQTSSSLEFSDENAFAIDKGMLNIRSQAGTGFVAMYKKHSFENFYAKVDVVFDQNKKDVFELVFGYEDENNFYSVKVDRQRDTFEICKNNSVLDAISAISLKENLKYTIEVECKDGLAEANLRSQEGEILKGAIALYSGHGFIGFAVSSQSRQMGILQVDNFEINTKKVPEPKKIVAYQNPDGIYLDLVGVTLFSPNPNYKVRYTLDGSTPNLESKTFDGTIPLTPSDNGKIRVTAQPEQEGVLVGNPIVFDYLVRSDKETDKGSIVADYMVPFALFQNYELFYPDAPLFRSLSDVDSLADIDTVRYEDMKTRMLASIQAGLKGWGFYLPVSKASFFDYLDDQLKLVTEIAQDVYEETGVHFMVMPQLNVIEDWNPTEKLLTECMKKLLIEYGDSPYVTHINGIPAFTTFTGDVLSPSQWAAVRENIENDPDIPERNKKFILFIDFRRIKRTQVYTDLVYKRYMDVCDGGYLYSNRLDAENSLLDQMLEGVESRQEKKYIRGSVEYMYWRPEIGNASNPQGTSEIRNMLKGMMERGVSLIHLCTWNDYSETAVEPSKNKSYVLADILNYFSKWMENGEEPTWQEDGIYFSQPIEVMVGEHLLLEVLGFKRTTKEKFVKLELENNKGEIVYTSKIETVYNDRLTDIALKVPTDNLYGSLWLRPILSIGDTEGNLSEKRYGDFISINRVTRANHIVIHRNIKEMLSEGEIIDIKPLLEGNDANATSFGSFSKSAVESLGVKVSNIEQIKDVKIYRGSNVMGDIDVQKRHYRVYSHINEKEEAPEGKQRRTIKIMWQGAAENQDNWGGKLLFEGDVKINGSLDYLANKAFEIKEVDGKPMPKWTSQTPMRKASSANKGVNGIIIDITYNPKDKITLDFESPALKDITFTLNELESDGIYIAQLSDNSGFTSICLTDYDVSKQPMTAMDESFVDFTYNVEYYDDNPMSFYYAEVQTADNRFLKSTPIYIQNSEDVSLIDSVVWSDDKKDSAPIKMLNIEKYSGIFYFEDEAGQSSARFKDFSGADNTMSGGGNIINRSFRGYADSSPVREGKGISFNGEGQFAVFTDSMVPIGASTIEFDLKVNSFTKNQNLLSIINGAYILNIMPGATLRFTRAFAYEHGNMLRNTANSTKKLEKGKWYKIAITNDCKVATVYVDDEPWCQIDSPGRARNGVMVLSNSPGIATNAFDGSIDNLKISAVPYR
ncbi:MAG: chitobiase/beta-hexosaminidase C-terminal domain-containing protein [Firmicutes bacterium]|nr:chitobiase/beta-hexosaminidase C-terminal domain-containing protein [Bacillota bacterium]